MPETTSTSSAAGTVEARPLDSAPAATAAVSSSQVASQPSGATAEVSGDDEYQSREESVVQPQDSSSKGGWASFFSNLFKFLFTTEKVDFSSPTVVSQSTSISASEPPQPQKSPEQARATARETAAKARTEVPGVDKIPATKKGSAPQWTARLEVPGTGKALLGLDGKPYSQHTGSRLSDITATENVKYGLALPFKAVFGLVSALTAFPRRMANAAIGVVTDCAKYAGGKMLGGLAEAFGGKDEHGNNKVTVNTSWKDIRGAREERDNARQEARDNLREGIKGAVWVVYEGDKMIKTAPQGGSLTALNNAVQQEAFAKYLQGAAKHVGGVNQNLVAETEKWKDVTRTQMEGAKPAPVAAAAVVAKASRAVPEPAKPAAQPKPAVVGGEAPVPAAQEPSARASAAAQPRPAAAVAETSPAPTEADKRARVAAAAVARSLRDSVTSVSDASSSTPPRSGVSATASTPSAAQAGRG